MLTRRHFIKLNGIATAGLSLGLTPSLFASTLPAFESQRPKLADRKFTSKAVEAIIQKVKKDIKDPELAWLFENCYPNTLDTTVNYSEAGGKPDTFVITGDINAMWMRDSSAQVWPYLPFIKTDPALKKLIQGVLSRQAKCVLIDPYANAFNQGPTGSEWDTDHTVMKPELHERKWEIDSLCYPVRLAYNYWKISGDTSFFDENWQKAGKTILNTFKEQQRKENKGPYYFQRKTQVASDTAPNKGYGNPVKPVGLICSIFRPSDDATIYPFLIPSNYFAVTSLNQMAEMFATIGNDSTTSAACRALASEVDAALKKYAVAQHPEFGKILAFEVDGYGNQLFMDDSNVPSLLALPYLDSLPATDPLYQNTRRFVLSLSNPYFFKGTAAEGIGGPHVGIGYIWPMAIIMRGLTSSNKEEITECLRLLKTTHAGTGFMHESFNKDNPADFTRKWFAWANTLFGELIIKTHQHYPDILQKTI
ncbi:glycoside hydrolase family 125 protein [Mucilaginibacter aquaedulcis]|uniref:glycoside hydrolase family 125 protein n=1 Tax=Mucilaginibacter aquaedulcis TaxID=1187081 RepID=UPI0025B558D4|nr:glycoside hydrolase family 125 protein [Mucilaginibacter aquaedulcis]MDN3549831.1 glycoside hydrolase family 125 protein [Mucilaginibacter aquaedulcis]